MTKRIYDVCVIAASAGGVQALLKILPALNAKQNLTTIVLLHMAEDHGFSSILASRCAVPVKVAEAGVIASSGIIWIAPSGYHLLLEKNKQFSLSADEKVCNVRPSANVLFTSVADAWREHVIGIVLTGSNEDGAEGLREIRSRDGLAIVQSPVEAEYPQMPTEALRIAGADIVLTLDQIAIFLGALPEG